MSARRKTEAVLLLFIVAACALFGLWNYRKTDKTEGLSQDQKQAHEDVWYLDREETSEDNKVNENFVSALPLVIIDTKPEQVMREVFGHEAGSDPDTRIKLSIIDRENKVNLLGDQPTGMVYGRLKTKESTSAPLTSPKKQYLLSLQIGEDQSFPMKLLRMDKSDMWLLTSSQADESYLRNYISMNTAGALSPKAQEIGLCEVIFCHEEEYEYMGLYEMYQIAKEEAGKNDIQGDIKRIEECLYSDQDSKFLEYRDLLDLDSFVDYFIINEFFLNDNHSWDSTSLYKDQRGKIHIRFTGGFASAVDQKAGELMEIQGMDFTSALWFDRLITDEYFVKKTVKRYEELRKTVLRQEILDEKLESAAKLIHGAAYRDRKRWSDLYHKDALEIKRDQSTGFMVDRNRNTWEEEVQRVKDTIRIHGGYLDGHMTDLYEYVKTKNSERPKTFLAICLIASFFASVILVQKVRTGGG